MHNRAMLALLLSLLGALRSAFRTCTDLALENLTLRQQLANFQRTSGRPRLHKRDRDADAEIDGQPLPTGGGHLPSKPIACPTWANSRACPPSTSPSAQYRPADGARMTGWRGTGGISTSGGTTASGVATSSMGKMVWPRWCHAVTLLPNGKVFIIGLATDFSGQPDPLIDELHPRTNRYGVTAGVSLKGVSSTTTIGQPCGRGL
jgi:hypothetical protein